MSNSITVVLRECGERTAGFCYRSLCQIFGEESVFRVAEKPFSAALRRSLQLGIAQKTEFILCVDADVIPIERELTQLVLEMESLPKHIPEIQGMVFDNLFRVIRPAGNHLYRASFAEKALNCIPVEGTSLRPESDMLSALIRKGNPWKQSRLLVGYHDFEQSYEDIYRKAFLHLKKHSDFGNYLHHLWQNLAVDQFEFEVALKAMKDSIEFKGEVKVDKSFLREESRKSLVDIGAGERSNMFAISELPAVVDMCAELDEPLRSARDECESQIHDRIFTSSSARMRRILSHRFFQPLFV
jgi:hypothetical protein